MTRASLVIEQLKAANVEFVCWLPDSETHFLHDDLVSDDELRLVTPCREGEALAIAAGINVAGRGATVVIEDQGLYDSGNELKWLKTLDTPVVLLVGYLFYSKNGPWGYLEPFLKAFDIPYFIVDSDDSTSRIAEAYARARRERGVVAVLLSSADEYVPGTGDSILTLPERSQPRPAAAAFGSSPVGALERNDALQLIAAASSPEDIVITTMSALTDWYEICGDLVSFNISGAMGFASSFALGLAIARPDRRIVVLDGDGSLLMNLGALVSEATAGVDNLLHCVLVNGVYELTGGIPTPGAGVINYSAMAAAAGIQRISDVGESVALSSVWTNAPNGDGPHFVVIRTRMAPPKPLPIGAGSDIERLRSTLADNPAAIDTSVKEGVIS